MPSVRSSSSVGLRARMALAVAALTVVAALLVAFEGLLFGFVSYWFLLLASGLLELFLGTAALGLVGAVVGYAAVLGVVFLAYHAAVTTERGFDVAPNLLGYAFVGSLIASLGVTFVVLDRLGTPGWAFALVLVTLVASVYPFMLFQIARERSEDDGSDEDEDPPWATEGDEAPWQVDSDSPPWVDDGSDDDGDENGSDDERGLDRTPLDTVRTLAGHAWTLLTGFVDRTGLLGVAGALVLASGTLAGVYVAAIRWSADELVRPLAALIALVLTTGHLAALVRSELADSAALGAFDEAYRTVEDPERRRALQARVERLAAQADVPAPRVRFVASTEPTAAAVGYRPGESTLVLSTGLVEALDDRELDAVVAHELAHVANHDAAVLTALSFPRVNAERLFDRYGINPVVSLLAGFVALTGRFCTAVVARAREYVADDGAAAMTGDPAALASALETLDARLGRRPTEDLRSAATAFGIVPPPWEEHRFFDRTRRLIFRRLLGTHPATEDRVERLRRAAAERES